ncbi:unnamed protein product [Linum trigynum]|uniref:Uncharacterized protein n=1 Tax=Linum trigynum TaxID=586398 RepID=A0AAV2EWT1_9ROSI
MGHLDHPLRHSTNRRQGEVDSEIGDLAKGLDFGIGNRRSFSRRQSIIAYGCSIVGGEASGSPSPPWSSSPS